MNKFIVSLLLTGAMLASCKSETKTVDASLKSETDSLAYVVGMNIADNLMAMDSTINVAVVCRAIAERAASKTIMSSDQARDYYLRYLTYVEPERKRGYEEQYLTDLVKADRRFTLSKSGMAYEIEIIGDESNQPKSTSDVVSFRQKIQRVDGEQIASSYDDADTVVMALGKLGDGLQESLKMIGEGGKVNAWIPSKLSYDQVGDSLLGVAPFETLYYEVELVKVESSAEARRRGVVL